MLIAKEILLDKNNDIISSAFIDLLLKIRFNGGYFIGHIKPIKKLIVFLEDLFTLRGLRSSVFARTLHWATGNSIFYIDYVNGSDAGTGADWANAWKTITYGATAARIAPGDTIRIAKSPDPTSLGQSATWNNLSKTVTLTTAVTANVSDCESAWTSADGANITVTAETSEVKEGSKSAKIVFGAGAGTGKAAYIAMGATDFSSYKQISFWIYNSVALSAGDLQIKLCSDNAGATPVDTFDIPAIASSGLWVPITVNKGSALGNSIQSVALYQVVDKGAMTVYLDNIIACKDATANDSLTLTSLISKNSLATGGSEAWYALQSINGTTLKIDNHNGCRTNQGRGYYGTTESVTTYKRETIKIAMVAGSSACEHGYFNENGTDGNSESFLGGYNTSSSLQDGETIWDGQNGRGYGIHFENNRAFIKVERISTYKFYNGAYINSSKNNDINMPYIMHNSNYGVYTTGGSAYNNQFNFGFCNNNFERGIQLNPNNKLWFNQANNAYQGSGVSGGGYDVGEVYGGVAANNASFGIDSATGKFFGVTTASNASGGVNASNNTLQLIGCTISESTEIATLTNYAGTYIKSYKHDNTADNHWIFTDGGTINSQTTTRHTASGIAWKMTTTGTHRTSNYPIKMKIAEVAVAANALVTAKVFIKKDHATNIAAKLVCRGKQISGVDSDVTATKASDTDWEELTITFTPTEAGVVEIEVWAYYVAGHSNVYVDDITITQA